MTAALDTPLFVTVREAARLVGISRSRAYALVNTGEWPSTNAWGRLLIPYRFLAELADQLTDSAESRGARARTTPAAIAVRGVGVDTAGVVRGPADASSAPNPTAAPFAGGTGGRVHNPPQQRSPSTPPGRPSPAGTNAGPTSS